MTFYFPTVIFWCGIRNLKIFPLMDLTNSSLIFGVYYSSLTHTTRSTVHSTMKTTPGAIVFHRDMFFDIPYIANLIMLRDKRQAIINYNLWRENNRRRNYDYRVGQQVYEIVKTKTGIGQKLQTQTRGPYTIEQVHTNGTLTIRRTPLLRDRVNIRQLRRVTK